MSSNAYMVFLRNKARRTLMTIIVLLSLLYPGIVYFGLDRVSPVPFLGSDDAFPAGPFILAAPNFHDRSAGSD